MFKCAKSVEFAICFSNDFLTLVAVSGRSRSWKGSPLQLYPLPLSKVAKTTHGDCNVL